MNKVVRHIAEGIDFEADPRHAEVVVKELGLGTQLQPDLLGPNTLAEHKMVERQPGR